MINFNKSALCISKGASRKRLNAFVSILGVKKITKDKKYLGNPLSIKKRETTIFEFLVNRDKFRIASWKARMLSQAGRNILIKSVASAILVYNMFVLHIPKDITNQIDKCLRKFLWGEKTTQKKFHTI